ncbi:MAG: hypothetical protein R6V06_10780 [Kiritimatiellia bacterium]
MICYIAGIKFEFSGIEADKFNRNFLPFLCPEPDGRIDAECHVDVIGASDDLCGSESNKPWSFQLLDGQAVLTGANADGELLWRMTGETPFEELSFAWNQDSFFETYNNKRLGSFGIIAVLALVLRLIELRGVVLHCSASVVDGAGIICTGRSGQGKSTVSGLLKEAGIDVLTDERAVIRIDESGLRVYGSPWPSSGMCVINGSAPLKKLYFLEHGPVNRLQSLTPGGTMKRLLDVVMVPWMNSDFFDPFIKVLEKVVSDVSASVLSFVPDSSVVDFIREDLNSGSARMRADLK